jgi:pimeloyl-ACP methyl ester carboxylesterase
MHTDVPQTKQVETGDGRRLRVELAGSGRRVVVVQVGSPNAGVLYDRWVRDAAGRDLTLIAYDRPGYGGSSPQPGRTVAACAADVRAISEAVGFGRCVVWGFSGGGPHALACAALLDELVAAVATIGSPAPFDAPGLDYLAGMPDDAREDTVLFLSDRAEWERKGEGQRDELLALSVDGLREGWSVGVSPGDRVALQGDFGAWLHRAVQAGLEPGVDGWMGDDVAFHSPWGFDPAAILVPVKVWHGREDRFVPFGHGRWLADTIPGAQAELSDDDGHLTVAADRIGDVHEWLAHHI